MTRVDMAVRKVGGVKLCRFARFTLIEPQACYELSHRNLLSETRSTNWF
jgi:hypothetical protein